MSIYFGSSTPCIPNVTFGAKIGAQKRKVESSFTSDNNPSVSGASSSSPTSKKRKTEESIFPPSRNFLSNEAIPSPRRISERTLEKLRAALQGLVSINHSKEQSLALNDDEWKTLWQYHNPATHTAEEFIQQVNSNFISMERPTVKIDAALEAKRRLQL